PVAGRPAPSKRPKWLANSGSKSRKKKKVEAKQAAVKRRKPSKSKRPALSEHVNTGDLEGNRRPGTQTGRTSRSPRRVRRKRFADRRHHLEQWPCQRGSCARPGAQNAEMTLVFA